MKVVIVIPTLDRAQLLDRLVSSIRATTIDGEYRLLFVVDNADRATSAKVVELGADLVFCDGTLPVKTNAGVRATTESAICLANDDVVFHDGWLDPAVAALEHHAVVGLNDLSPMAAERSTQWLLRRSYVEDPGAAWGEPGNAMHEGYWHNFVDDELVGLAKHRGTYVYEPTSIVEHLHPSWGKAEIDSTYEVGAFQHMDEDGALYKSRRRDWLKGD